MTNSKKYDTITLPLQELKKTRNTKEIDTNFVSCVNYQLFEILLPNSRRISIIAVNS